MIIQSSLNLVINTDLMFLKEMNNSQQNAGFVFLILGLVLTIGLLPESIKSTESRNFHSGLDKTDKMTEEPNNLKLMDHKATSFTNGVELEYKQEIDKTPNRHNDVNRR